MLTTHRAEIFGIALAVLLFLMPSLGKGVSAQSTDVAWPTPVRAREVSGIIPARDIGDARLTDHFYAFTGTPGDVLITVDSLNLNGDIDVFTFAGMRPLLKFTVYAGSSAQIQKGIYLRQREDLVLRIEGRTPNDDEASYRIKFSGSFEPITSGPLAEHDDAARSDTASDVASRSGHRVTSAGARIDEPRSEVVVAPTPEPTPAEVKKAETKAPATSRRNTTTIRRLPPGNRRTRPAPKPKPEATAKAPAEDQPATSEEPETARTTPPKRSTSTRRNRPAPAVPAEPSAAEETGPRLIIETNDGTLVDRFMTTVRRVTVENGQVVVIGKDGKFQRIPLASVLRMTIAP